MKSNRILVPVDLEKAANSFDALRFAADAAEDPRVTATLLYVVTLNILSPDRHVFDEVCLASEIKLKKLAKLFFKDGQKVHCVVRMGEPPREIVAEAESESTDMLLFSSPSGPRWSRWFASRTTEKVARTAPCPTLVLPLDGNTTPGAYRRMIWPNDSRPPAAPQTGSEAVGAQA